MSVNCYITFPTTFYAIRSESLLKDVDSFLFKMMPVPRAISSSCGTALRCSCDQIESIRTYLLSNDIELEKLYSIEESGLQRPRVEELSFPEN